VSPAETKQKPLSVAASNWHALASFASRFVEGHRRLLIDVGSTTTDVIPLDHHGPAAIGRTDPERLLSRELCTQGRSDRRFCDRVAPVVAGRAVPWGRASSLQLRLNACSLMLEELAEEERKNLETADGRPPNGASRHTRDLRDDLRGMSRCLPRLMEWRSGRDSRRPGWGHRRRRSVR